MINKISFTGGEPTTNITKLYEAIHFIRNNLQNIFIVVNTNGYNLYWLYGLHDEFKIDSIALSRHHYFDSINEMIFGVKTVPNFKMIQEYQKQFNNIHLSCNLIKGYIDSQVEVERYLEQAHKLGVYDVGFVGLMPVTKFAEKSFVDFSKIIVGNGKVCCNLEGSYKGICKCSNYLFLPKTGDKVVKFYARHRMKDSTPVGSNLYFNGKNLMENFAGKIII
jgi:molybdenum cofactor biosynthesis enzyme MoaA